MKKNSSKENNCRRFLKGLCLSALFGVGFLFGSSSSQAAGIDVVIPSERAVYQRDYNNKADLNVEAKGDTAGLRARVTNGDTVLCDWTSLTKSSDGVFTGVLKDVNAGGWYKVEFESLDDSGNVVEQKSIEKVGVGEVFITGGQSNSANFGGEKTKAVNDTVSAMNPKNGSWVHCEDSQPSTSDYSTGNGGGSPWPTLGDELVNSLGVPVGFISTGRGNTKISELGGKYYDSIKKAIDLLKPYGCRAFLIHQGEADIQTSSDKYKADYEELIKKTREDAGYNLNWVVAQVSYAWYGFNDTAKAEAITGVQRGICNNFNIFEGPTTDDMQGSLRYKKDHLHMSLEGLIEHGKRWATALTKAFYTPYKLELDSNIKNGKIILPKTEFNGGETIALTVEPDYGYKLVPGSIKVTDEAGNTIDVENNTFTMHAENMKLTAAFEVDPDAPATTAPTPEATSEPSAKPSIEPSVAPPVDQTESPQVTDVPPTNAPETSTLPAVSTDIPVATKTPDAGNIPSVSATPDANQIPSTSALPDSTIQPEAQNTNVSDEGSGSLASNSLGKVNGLKASKKGAKKAKISWKKVKNAKKYKLTYSTDKAFKKNVKNLTVKKTNTIVKGLKKGKKYYFKVMAISGKSKGKYSGVKKLKM